MLALKQHTDPDYDIFTAVDHVTVKKKSAELIQQLTVESIYPTKPLKTATFYM